MSKRLQVVMSEAEWKAYQRAARAKKIPLSEWVRQALRSARESEPGVSVDQKLGAVRAAVQHHFPTGNIDQMLAEIERGYGPGPLT
jgi:hypothetical protein